LLRTPAGGVLFLSWYTTGAKLQI